jgi:hypothetical protein
MISFSFMIGCWVLDPAPPVRSVSAHSACHNCPFQLRRFCPKAIGFLQPGHFVCLLILSAQLSQIRLPWYNHACFSPWMIFWHSAHTVNSHPPGGCLSLNFLGCLRISGFLLSAPLLPRLQVCDFAHLGQQRARTPIRWIHVRLGSFVPACVVGS